MKERLVTVKNEAGIHCRPASVILNAIMQDYPNDKFIVSADDGQEVELDSILSLISLGLACGRSCTLKVEGPDEEAAAAKIGDLFEYNFDFPDASAVV